MSVDEFRFVVQEIRPFTDYVYLHVLGEPLLHPHFQEMLQVASDVGLKVNISTNGSLLRRHIDFLTEHPVRQLNISLHDAEENIPRDNWPEFIQSMLEFAQQLSQNTFINFRLWNQTNQASEEFNEVCLKKIQNCFTLPELFYQIPETERNITL